MTGVYCTVPGHTSVRHDCPDCRTEILARAAVELWNEYGDPNDILSAVQVVALDAASEETST